MGVEKGTPPLWMTVGALGLEIVLGGQHFQPQAQLCEAGVGLELVKSDSSPKTDLQGRGKAERFSEAFLETGTGASIVCGPRPLSCNPYPSPQRNPPVPLPPWLRSDLGLPSSPSVCMHMLMGVWDCPGVKVPAVFIFSGILPTCAPSLGSSPTPPLNLSPYVRPRPPRLMLHSSLPKLCPH